MKRLVLIAILLCGCAGSPPPRAGDAVVATARRAEAAGRHAEGARAYDQASTEAQSDKDKSAYALAAAREAERGGDLESAGRRYEAIAHLRLPDAPIALMRLALMRAAANDAVGARGFLAEILRSHPASGVATRALLLHVGDAKEREVCEQRLAETEALVRSANATELSETYAYMNAECIDATGRGKEALTLYLQIAQNYPPPSGHYNTESLIRAAELQQSYGDNAGAILTLKQLLRQREHSQTIGSYEKPAYAIAQSRIATIYATQLHDTRSAEDAWGALFRDFPDSRLRDDGAFEAALIQRQHGDASAACGWLKRLKDVQPTSRYVRCIPAWCEAQSGAKCAEYLNERWQNAAAKQNQ